LWGSYETHIVPRIQNVGFINATGSGILRLKCDGTRAETRFGLSAKWTSPFKSAGASVQSTAGSRGVRISGSNAGCTMFRGSVKGTGYPLHSPVSSSLSLPRVTVCHHVSTGLYVWLPPYFKLCLVTWLEIRECPGWVPQLVKLAYA
jgi:hypothetical protein